MNKHHLRAFSLVEMIATVAIIALLLALVQPAYKKIQTAQKRAVCASNLRQIAAAGLQFANDHQGNFPSSRLYNSIDNPTEPGLVEYMGNNPRSKVFQCPELARYPFSPALQGINHTYTLALRATNNPSSWYTSDPTKQGSNPIGKVIRVESPAKAAWILDGSWSDSGWFSSSVRSDDISHFVFPHSRFMNVAYVDGHVGQISSTDTQFTDSNSVFWTGGAP